jgi:2-polyprenyl-3-methyl-5-hydroxy-6-metoxy-1,4-benzoquinol methylase
MTTLPQSNASKWRVTADGFWEKVPCNVCGADETVLFARTKDLYSQRIYTIVRCTNCNLVYVNPRRSDFEEGYATNEKALPYFLSKMHSESSAFFFPASVLLKFKQRGMVLDVGCGIGHFLLEMRKRSFQVYGIELNQQCAEYGREHFGLEISPGTLDAAPFGDKQFDVITLLSTLEHLGTPQELLRNVKRVLKDDGVILMSLPNIRYLLLRIVHLMRWDMHSTMLDPTGHLYYFSRETLRGLCKVVGLTVVYEECGLVSSLRAEGSFYKNIVKKIVFPISNYMELGSMLTFVCKKNHSDTIG